jgi:ferredoxin--NADP+ reductase
MSYVVTEPCLDVLDLTCIEVCPVDCIHPTKNDKDYGNTRQVYIDPGACIDCDACTDVCPVDAIYADEDLPPEYQPYARANRDYYRRR